MVYLFNSIFIEFFNIKIDLGKLINDDFTGENYEKGYTFKIYDMTYNELISKII